ncbi:N-acetylglucosamine-6-phosphate deacetylase [Hydromonas duriensis]|uniref:N-acetylglucosamine 6-phosphate deacetylase n=1 Tax=Hydromonas duriensis TaxID=1527608 RepID=A0A4R6YAA0_9BURK|nr:N-acetylglucosamine-6-phosphate deacetylase [Hydromonas duriensis]TDR32409.1 N-acetylglucosamine 6-phosphate deacetylase [Hydromonas duriensis]
MSHSTITGRILTSKGWLDGALHVMPNGQIGEVTGSAPASEGAQRYVLPGFIDVHVHGGGGVDIMQGGATVTDVARLHVQFGTTSLLATTMTAPMAEIQTVLKHIQVNTQVRPTGSARVLGVHLEGPYINPSKLGAQPAHAKRAFIQEVDALCDLVDIRLVTIAPELEGHLDMVEHLSRKGVRVQIGHTLGSYEDGVKALEKGASGFTHLFNAMTPLKHREPGMVGAAMAHAEYSEIIPDLLHVHPGAIRCAHRAIPRLFCVTDSTAAAGMPDGEYKLGSQVVNKCLGGVRLADGTLAGSTLTMDQALRNLVSIGMSLEEASNMLSLFPADYLGLADRGRLETGAWADVVVLDAHLKIVEVYVEGERIEFTHVPRS